MNQEDKVATCMQSKRLVELGVVLETEKYWVFEDDEGPELRTYKTGLDSDFDSWYPAPDAAELGEVLLGYHINSHYYSDKDSSITDVWWLTNWPSCATLHEFFNVGSEAQARCAAYIWLIENKHIKV